MKNIVAVSLDTVHTSKLINEKVIINITKNYIYSIKQKEEIF